MNPIKRWTAAALTLGATLPLLANAAPVYTVLHKFSGGNDGEQPLGLVFQNGTLYGATNKAGAGNAGTVFQMDPLSGAESVIYSFNGGSDGNAPEGPLAYDNGKLFGVTAVGGTAGKGTVFSIDIATGTETVLHSFTEAPLDGAKPYGGVIYRNGALYGTTYGGGPANLGTVFSVNAGTGAEQLIYKFKRGDSVSGKPQCELTWYNGGLYGAGGGGPALSGQVFRVGVGTGTASVLYDFAGGNDGWVPLGRLLYLNGSFYGTTEGGGSANQGVIYRIDASTGTETVLYNFTGGSDGAQPMSGLTVHGHTLFGVTQTGGNFNMGTVFAFDLDTQTETVLHRFQDRNNGAYPGGELVYQNGSLYGVTDAGGLGDLGVVFRLTL